VKDFRSQVVAGVFRGSKEMRREGNGKSKNKTKTYQRKEKKIRGMAILVLPYFLFLCT
jgi:hypothetical protein